MGSSSYSHDDYTARVSFRKDHSVPVFAHDMDVKTGKTAAKVHDKLDPKGVAMRECRDSIEHPVSLPVAVLMDVTGSMGQVPGILEANLPKLMGSFIDDKASGKNYLGDAYPAIMVGAIDDYDAMQGHYRSPSGTFQVGQFESGIEIDNDLEKIWLTGLGGGTYEESYNLAAYFMARHTVHDHFEKRGRKGYLFLIGDEMNYPSVLVEQVKNVIGDNLQVDIPIADIFEEVKQRYHVFFIIPNMTSHYSDPKLRKHWEGILGQQNVILLDDPAKICQTIVSAVAICEQYVGIDDLLSDGVADGSVSTSLAKLVNGTTNISKYSAENLPSAPASNSSVERL